jgi:5-methylcytosine-specific restriction endonuclease McrA
VPWGRKNNLQHAALQCMWAQYDHIIPHSRGGTSDIENIYLACAACNYGRMQYTLEEVGLLHPRCHEPRRGTWDGLERFR